VTFRSTIRIMRNLVTSAAVAFLFCAAARSDRRPLASLPDHFVIARHTFFDFGPPNDYYELFFVRPNSNGASVERIVLTPKIDACRNPRLEVRSGTIATNPAVLLGKTNPCAIPEKDLKREFNRCKKCPTFSGAYVTMQVECGEHTRTIRSKVLDKDMFDPRSDTPAHTSWTQGLMAQLDASVGPGVMGKPMFQTAEDHAASLTDKEAPELQDIAAGKYDSLFQEAPDKPSDLYRGSQLPASVPTVRLTRVSPSTPISSPLPKYSSIATLAHVQGEVTFTVEVDAKGYALHVFVYGTPLLRQSVENAVRGWKFAEGDSNRQFEGAIEFALNCLIKK
jgi:hypothetical protein